MFKTLFYNKNKKKKEKARLWIKGKREEEME